MPPSPFLSLGKWRQLFQVVEVYYHHHHHLNNHRSHSHHYHHLDHHCYQNHHHHHNSSTINVHIAIIIIFILTVIKSAFDAPLIIVCFKIVLVIMILMPYFQTIYKRDERRGAGEGERGICIVTKHSTIRQTLNEPRGEGDWKDGETITSRVSLSSLDSFIFLQTPLYFVSCINGPIFTCFLLSLS